MNWMTPVYLLIALLLVLLNGFFVLAEFALVKVRSSRIEELVRQGSRRALVTPVERPNVQVFLLAQLAAVAGSEFTRERLCRAQSRQELVEIIAAADPEGRKGTQVLEENDQAQCKDRWRDDGGQGGFDKE